MDPFFQRVLTNPSHFDRLPMKDGFIFADNAGGSQCLQGVVDRISDYLLRTNVQLGANFIPLDLLDESLIRSTSAY